MDAGTFHHRFELLPHDSVRPDHDWRVGIVKRQQALGILLAPSLDPARDEPAWMRVFEGERIDRVCWNLCGTELLALAICSSEHGVHELARSDSMAAFRQLDCLSDRGIGGNATHIQQLVDA